MLNIDQFAYLSKLRHRDPMEKLFFAILTLGVCLWADWIVISIAVLFIMGWVSVREGGTPLPLFVKLMLVPFSFLILSVLTIAFGISENPREFSFAVPMFGTFLGVSKISLITAGGLFCKALGGVSCLYYLSLTTPMIDLLAALRRLKLPGLLIELMSLVYRFIFILLETAENMVTAQNSRLGYANLSSGYRSLSVLASNLFIRAYKRSDQLYTALESRGYEGELNVLTETYPKCWQGYVVALVINILLVMAAWFFK